MSFLYGAGAGATGATGAAGAAGATGPAGVGIIDEVFNAEDDGFDVEATLDPKWTQATSGTAPTVAINPIYARSCYLVKFAGVAIGSVSLTQPFAPAGDFAFTCKLKVLFRGLAGTSRVDLYVGNTALNDGVVASVVANGAAATCDVLIRRLDTFATVGSATPISYRQAEAMYLHVQRVGSTNAVFYSFDGVTWQGVSANYTNSATIGKILFDLLQTGTANKEIVALDWVRRDWFVW